MALFQTFLLIFICLQVSMAVRSRKPHLHFPVTLCRKDACDSKFYSSLTKLPNIGYVGGSYNIFNGNPEAIGGNLDPGFVGAQNIFDFTYNNQETTTDGAYLIPDGTTVNSVESCSFSFASSVTRDTQSYTNSLKVHVDAKFKYYGASFSASSDYQQVKSSTASGQNVFVSSQAECETYGAAIDDAPLSPFFISDVTDLPSPASSLTPYVDFIRMWGTHVASSIMMGGRYGLRSQISSTNYNSMESTKLNIKASAGYSGLVSVDASLATDVQKEQAQTFESNRKDVQVFQLGGKPPVDENGTVFAWAQTVKDSPMPLSYKLTEIYKYLNNYTFPNDTNILDKQNNLRLAIAQYCKDNVPNPELCDQQYGPTTNKSTIKVSLLNQIIESSNLYTFHQYSENPNMRAFGSVKVGSPFTYDGKLPISSPFVMADIRFASPNITADPIGIVGYNLNGDMMRYKCPNGFYSLSDQVAVNDNLLPPLITCVAEHCLTSCSKGSRCDNLSFIGCFYIASGYPELGNQQDKGFFRDLTIQDPAPESDLFKCLTYDCLEVV